MVVIIHAVGDLIVSPKQSYRFWKIAPFDLCIFLASVIVTIFTTLEIGIYVSFGVSMVILLYRVARPGGEFLGRARIKVVEGEDPGQGQVVYYDTYVPIRRKNLNPNIHVEDAPPGILIYRFEESFTFPNSSLINDRIVDYAKEKTRRGRAVHYKTLGDRPWNEGFVSRSMDKIRYQNEHDDRPLLRAVIYDFSAVSAIDTTSVQSLIDTRQQLDRYADREVEYHFVSILDPWIKRGLVAGGFGVGKPAHRLVEVASMVPITDAEDPRTHGEEEFQRRRRESKPAKDVEVGLEIEPIPEKSRNNVWSPSFDSHAAVVATNYPFFHLDLETAVRSAESGAPPAE
jgi:solute carrier family 26 (sodium-independent sulfate anion transporter), member 11